MTPSLLQQLVDALSAELERPVLLDDAMLRPLAYSRQWGALDTVRTESILSRGATPAVRRALFAQGIADAEGPVRTARAPKLGMEERVCVPARTGGSVRGYLWLLDPGAVLAPEELARVVGAAKRAAELLAVDGQAATWLREQPALVAALCSADPDDRLEAAREVRARGLLAPGPYVVTIAGPGTEGTLAVLGARLSSPHALAGRDDAGMVVLLSLRDAALAALRVEEIASRVLKVLRGHGLEAAVGQSAVAHELELAHVARRQAAVALRAARTRPPEKAHAAWDTLGADRLVGQLDPGALGDVPPALARMLREEPMLTATLTAFLDHAGDVPAVAAELNLHRSGVYYRLRRITDMTGLDLTRGDDRLLAHLAARLARLED
jgi:hypothetical protein